MNIVFYYKSEKIMPKEIFLYIQDLRLRHYAGKSVNILPINVTYFPMANQYSKYVNFQYLCKTPAWFPVDTQEEWNSICSIVQAKKKQITKIQNK